MPNRKSRILLPFLLLTTILIITATSCNMFNEPEGGNGGSLTLTVEDASCTEAWIKLNETNAELPASVKLYANDTLKQTLELTTADTLIYDEGLLPNRAYAYRAELIKPQKPTVKSQTVTASTLDTTSHDFTWETFTFGGANGSSYLRDVAIINENDIWAVGEIHTSWTDQWDSNGVWVQPYNAVHWNGQEWELRRALFLYQGNLMFSSIHSILAFSSDDIWFEAGIHWNGENFETIPFNVEFNSHVNAMWGTSSSDFYVVGNNGNIAHYDGSGWEKIESGTEYDCYDIYSGNGTDVYIAGGDLFYDTGGILLKGNTSGIETIEEGKSLGSSTELFNPYFDGVAKTLWISKTGTIFFAGSWLYKLVNGKTGFEKHLAGNYWGGNTNGQYFGFISKIRGIAENQIVVVGERNTIRYFNGVNWKQLGMLYNTNNEYTWLSVGMTNNLIVVVGYANAKSTIMMLKR